MGDYSRTVVVRVAVRTQHHAHRELHNNNNNNDNPMAPPKKKPRVEPSSKRGVDAAPAAGAAQPVVVPPTADALAEVGPPATGLTDEAQPQQQVAGLKVTLANGQCRLPQKPTVQQQHDQAVPVAHLGAIGTVVLMLSDAWVIKGYEHPDASSYTLTIDVGRQFNTGRMGKVFVTLAGVIESINTRDGDDRPTMRLRLDPADHVCTQELGGAIIKALSCAEGVHRMQQTNRHPKNNNKRRTKCTFMELRGEFPDATWFNRYIPQDLLVYSVNPTTGKVMRRPEFWEGRPIDNPKYEGLSVRVLCSVKVKVTAPLQEFAQSKAVVKLQFTPHQLVFLGEEREPVHRTSIESLNLEMDDDAPEDQDPPPPPPLGAASLL